MKIDVGNALLSGRDPNLPTRRNKTPPQADPHRLVAEDRADRRDDLLGDRQPELEHVDRDVRDDAGRHLALRTEAPGSARASQQAGMVAANGSQSSQALVNPAISVSSAGLFASWMSDLDHRQDGPKGFPFWPLLPITAPTTAT